MSIPGSRCRSLQNFLHVGSLCVCRPHSIGSFRESDGSVPPEIHNGFRLPVKAMNMSRRIVGKDNEANTAESQRNRSTKITQAA